MDACYFTDLGMINFFEIFFLAIICKKNKNVQLQSVHWLLTLDVGDPRASIYRFIDLDGNKQFSI